jgi:hypothetical protein
VLVMAYIVIVDGLCWNLVDHKPREYASLYTKSMWLSKTYFILAPKSRTLV